MKKILLLLTICSSIFLSGCFSYRDINKVMYVTTVIVDIDKDDNPVMYVEVFKPVKGSQGSQGQEAGDGKRIIFKGTGKTILEAIRDINLSSSYKVNYTQNKAVIFTEKAARYGMDNFTDIFDRDQELIIRPKICILIGDPEKFITATYEENKYIGMFIDELLENVKQSSRAVNLPLNNYYIQRLIGDRTNVITVIKLKKNTFGDKITIEGGAVIYEDKMLDELTREQGQGFNFLMNAVSGGTLEITNPDARNKFVTLEILKSTTKTDLSYDGQQIVLTKNISVTTTIASAQEKFYLTKENIHFLQRKAEKNIEKYTMEIFNKYKYDHLDIFDITEELYRKYPDANLKDVMGKTELKVNAEVKIQSSGDTTNWRPSNK